MAKWTVKRNPFNRTHHIHYRNALGQVRDYGELPSITEAEVIGWIMDEGCADNCDLVIFDSGTRLQIAPPGAEATPI